MLSLGIVAPGIIVFWIVVPSLSITLFRVMPGKPLRKADPKVSTNFRQCPELKSSNCFSSGADPTGD
jgi:hypothetical protein